MATYEQAMEALRRADAEGNVEDAQKLAEIASKLRPEGAGGGRGLMGGPTAEGKARAATGLSELIYETVKKGVTQPVASHSRFCHATRHICGSISYST